MNAEKMFDHIMALAKAFGIDVDVDDEMRPDGASANLSAARHMLTGHRMPEYDRKMIRIYPVIDETTYAAALHELGHLCSPTGMLSHEQSESMQRYRQPVTLRDVRLTLVMEDAAWTWAKHYALEWTPLMQHTAQMNLETYLREARRLGVK